MDCEFCRCLVVCIYTERPQAFPLNRIQQLFFFFFEKLLNSSQRMYDFIVDFVFFCLFLTPKAQKGGSIYRRSHLSVKFLIM